MDDIPLQSLIELRHDLHRHPELSGHEEQTAARICRAMEPLQPDQVLTQLGGPDRHGLAFVFEGPQPGPTLVLRCELDALPIQETNEFSHRSTVDGVSHKCGHDGHMSILVGVAHGLAQSRPSRGRVVLLFQPAEETGQGARWVLQDPRFQALEPDGIFALHNLPHYPRGQVLVRPGAMACASRGMKLTLTGKTSHAAWPEHGSSPAIAMCRVLEGLSLLPVSADLLGSFNLVTIIHVRLGEVAFGTSPGEAQLFATLRSDSNKGMRYLVEQGAELSQQWVSIHGLQLQLEWCDIFELSENDPDAALLVQQAAHDAQMSHVILDEPLRASEDFGVFTQRYPGALFGLGAGLHHPQLHNPDFDFPDDLIEAGVLLYRRLIQAFFDSKSKEISSE